MSRLFAGLAAAALLSVPAAAHAQFSVNKIQNSGNGVNNTVVARNGPARFPGFPGPIYPYGQAGGFDQGFGGYGYGQPVGYPGGYGVFDGGFPGGPGFGVGPGVGGFGGRPLLRNVIRDSGNGIGNAIVARNRGGFGGGFGPFDAGPAGYPFGPHGVFGPGGLNINVVTNSGNGIGNAIHAGNRGGPGGVNVNVITNSGNGIGNTIRARNR
jgi:hypothetical protein